MCTIRLQAYKFELMPDGQQERLMRRFSGACRFVFNNALVLQKANYEAGGKFISYENMAKLLTEWRNGTATPWLKSAPVHPLQHALKDLDRAYKNFFAKRAGFPNFKRKGGKSSFRYPDAKQFKLDQGNASIFLPKLGWVRYRKSRSVEGELCNATVSECSGRWFISIQTEREITVPIHPDQQREIALDMGARKNWALLIGQDGAMVKTLNAYRSAERRLKHLQRCLSRKKKGSRNRAKARARLNRCHAKAANTRADFLHKASNHLTRDYGSIILEDLKVQAMTASKKNPKARNKAILDQGWHMLRTMLEYKAQWRGGMVIAVDPARTSTTCAACGYNDKANRHSPDSFQCLQCGHQDQADRNAAINIQRAGHAQLACGEHVSRRAIGAGSTKQEPAEVTMQGATHA